MDEAVRRQLSRAQDELKKTGAQVKWVEPRSIHLTIKFLGEIASSQVSEAAGILSECCRGVSPFALRVQGVGAFPSPSRPQVVWAGVEGPPELSALVSRLEEKLEPLGVPREQRAFKPHLTLGRAKGPKGMERLGEGIARLAGTAFGETQVSEVLFMLSELSGGGPIYTPLHRVPLA